MYYTCQRSLSFDVYTPIDFEMVVEFCVRVDLVLGVESATGGIGVTKEHTTNPRVKERHAAPIIIYSGDLPTGSSYPYYSRSLAKNVFILVVGQTMHNDGKYTISGV